jgi:hypothetical protein
VLHARQHGLGRRLRSAPPSHRSGEKSDREGEQHEAAECVDCYVYRYPEALERNQNSRDALYFSSTNLAMLDAQIDIWAMEHDLSRCADVRRSAGAAKHQRPSPGDDDGGELYLRFANVGLRVETSVRGESGNFPSGDPGSVDLTRSFSRRRTAAFNS